MEVTADPARGLEVRTRLITQTLTRPSTTITTVVTLGGGPTIAPTPTTISTTSSPFPAGTITPAPASALTPQQLGAILGSVLGLAFIILVLCCCISVRRRREQTIRYAREHDEYGYGGGYSVSETDVFQAERWRSAPVWNLYRGRGATGTWTTVPPPVRFPPTPRHTPYSQTREEQIRGVRRYP